MNKCLLESKKMREDFFININNLLSLVYKEYSKKKKEVIEEYDLNFSDKFNIFETISDLYKREKFHSDILYTILYPHTPQIGGVAKRGEFVKRFINILGLSDKFDVDDTIEISKEEYSPVYEESERRCGYIDLLITNNHNQAIIIENKLNDAPDMPNQIVRYMKYIQEEKFGKDKEVDMTVVYLTLIPGKKPDIGNYHKSFEDYTNLIIDAKDGKDGEILKYRCAIDSDKEKGSLVKFLSDCLLSIEELNDVKDKDVILTKVYLEQYKILLGHLGGNIAMLDYQKELLKNIYSSKENYQATKDLVEVFNNKKDVLNALINDKLKEIVPEEFYFFDNWAYIIKNDAEDYLYVAGWNGGLQIGFGNNNGGISKRNQKIYQDILKEIYKIEITTETCEGCGWVYLDIEPLGGRENLDNFLKFYTDLLVEVKRKFLEVK